MPGRPAGGVLMAGSCLIPRQPGAPGPVPMPLSAPGLVKGGRSSRSMGSCTRAMDQNLGCVVGGEGGVHPVM